MLLLQEAGAMRWRRYRRLSWGSHHTLHQENNCINWVSGLHDLQECTYRLHSMGQTFLCHQKGTRSENNMRQNGIEQNIKQSIWYYAFIEGYCYRYCYRCCFSYCFSYCFSSPSICELCSAMSYAVWLLRAIRHIVQATSAQSQFTVLLTTLN